MTPASNLAPVSPPDELQTPDSCGVPYSAEPVTFYGIDYVDTVAEYFDPDPKLMRGDGLRQVWPPGALEKICRARVRR